MTRNRSNPHLPGPRYTRTVKAIRFWVIIAMLLWLAWHMPSMLGTFVFLATLMVAAHRVARWGR
jgi:hypothetical protein